MLGTRGPLARKLEARQAETKTAPEPKKIKRPVDESLETARRIIVEEAEAAGILVIDVSAHTHNRRCVQARNKAAFRIACETIKPLKWIAGLLGWQDRTSTARAIQSYAAQNGIPANEVPRGLGYIRGAARICEKSQARPVDGVGISGARVENARFSVREKETSLQPRQ